MQERLRSSGAGLQAQVNRLRQGYGAWSLLKAQVEEALAQAEREKAEAETLDHVVALLGAMQETWREQFQAGVGKVVSRGLTGVFGEDLELLVEMGQSGDLPVAKFSIRDSRGLETDVIDSRGGGLVSVTAFLLRVLLLLSARPALARLLVLDETFANLSAEYVGNLVALIRRIATEGGFQCLIVTHRPELVDGADVAYRFELKDGVTQVTQVKRASDDAAQMGHALSNALDSRPQSSK